MRLSENKPVQVDQAKNRVEQLDAQPEQKMQMMSQKEYIYTMETNHENLRRAWDAGERVQALKIAIQVCTHFEVIQTENDLFMHTSFPFDELRAPSC